MLNWSNNPGCFERHLQRKYLFPYLFSTDSNIISNDELENAKHRDMEDVSKLNNDVTEFLHYLGHNFTVDEVKGLLDRFEKLEERAASIGGNATSLGKALREGRKEMLTEFRKTLSDKKIDIDDEFYRTFFTLGNITVHPFFAQCNRNDTPIKSNEQVLSLLTESSETVAEVIEIFKSINEEWVGNYKKEVTRIVKLFRKELKTIPGLNKKLKAFGFSTAWILFNVTLKII